VGANVVDARRASLTLVSAIGYFLFPVFVLLLYDSKIRVPFKTSFPPKALGGKYEVEPLPDDDTAQIHP
jgi:hypothetical protein